MNDGASPRALVDRVVAVDRVARLIADPLAARDSKENACCVSWSTPVVVGCAAAIIVVPRAHRLYGGEVALLVLGCVAAKAALLLGLTIRNCTRWHTRSVSSGYVLWGKELDKIDTAWPANDATRPSDVVPLDVPVVGVTEAGDIELGSLRQSGGHSSLRTARALLALPAKAWMPFANAQRAMMQKTHQRRAEMIGLPPLKGSRHNPQPQRSVVGGKRIAAVALSSADIAGDLHHMSFDQHDEEARMWGGRLPTNEEVRALLGGQPHPLGVNHDSWIPTRRADGRKDWVQTGDRHRLGRSHIDHHNHYPGWGDQAHHRGHMGWMMFVVADAKRDAATVGVVGMGEWRAATVTELLTEEGERKVGLTYKYGGAEDEVPYSHVQRRAVPGTAHRSPAGDWGPPNTARPRTMAPVAAAREVKGGDDVDSVIDGGAMVRGGHYLAQVGLDHSGLVLMQRSVVHAKAAGGGLQPPPLGEDKKDEVVDWQREIGAGAPVVPMCAVGVDAIDVDDHSKGSVLTVVAQRPLITNHRVMHFDDDTTMRTYDGAGDPCIPA